MGGVTPFAQMMVGPVLGGLLAAFDVGARDVRRRRHLRGLGLCVLLLRPPGVHAPRRGPRPPPWADFREGLAYVRRTPWLLVNLLSGVVDLVRGVGLLHDAAVARHAGATARRATSFGYLLAVGGVASRRSTAVVVGTLRPRGGRWHRRT